MHLIKQISINNLFLPANRFPILSAILCFPLDCTLIGGLSVALLLVSPVSVKQTDGDFPIHKDQIHIIHTICMNDMYLILERHPQIHYHYSTIRV